MTRRTGFADDDRAALTRRFFLQTIPLLLATGSLPRCGVLHADEPEIKPPKFLLAWGKKGKGEGELLSPIGIAVSPAGEVYVTETNGKEKHNRIQRFTAEGKFLAAINVPSQVASPAGLAVDAEGNICVPMMGDHRVCVLAPDGKEIRQWGKKGAGDGEFNEPGAVVIGTDGSIYVSDQINRRIQKFTPEGKFLAKWGEYGKKPGQFDGMEGAGSRFGGPNFLGVDSKGNIFSTEGVLGRVQQFSADGKPLQAWGNKGNDPGGFGGLATVYSRNTFGPVGTCVDRQDRVWVGSIGNNRIQLYTAAGKYLTGIGGTGGEPGQFRMPHALAVDSHGHLYVADSGNNRIQKFLVPGAETKTAPEK
jgi:tripartite motif-containing protein 71